MGVIKHHLVVVGLAGVLLGGRNLEAADRVQTEKPQVAQFWRDVNHGGLNALYVLLRMYGEQRTYSEYLHTWRERPLPQTAADLLRVSRDLGWPLEARLVSPEQLDSIRLPVIVHMEGDSSAEGYFFVLLQTQPQRMMYLDGSTATVSTMDKEPFLRRWSGVVIRPRSNRISSDVIQTLCGAVCGLGLVFFWSRR